ncbi:MAG: hypothetical protein ACREO3_01010 [Arenimonas sp.]
MSDGRVTVIDRRAEYYRRAASAIAADPLDFYTRAERGRQLLRNWHTPVVAALLPNNVLTLPRKKRA